MKGVLHVDGGARGNPGPAGIGVVLVGDNGAVMADRARGIGVATNNVAEYKALIEGLRLALDHGVSELDVFSDSELLVRQLKGEWRIKDERLRLLAGEAHSLLRRFARASVSHVPRDRNADADRLANQGMDAAELDVVQDREAGQGSLLAGE